MDRVGAIHYRVISVQGSDLPLVVTAVSAVAAARYVHIPEHLGAIPSPLIAIPMIMTMTWWGMAHQRRMFLALVLILVVIIRGHGQIRSLERPLPSGTLTGPARVVTDPTRRDFDLQAVIALDGRRYVASMPPDGADVFRSVEVGEVVMIEGTVRPIEGAPSGWVLSNHLAGRLRLRSVVLLREAPPWYRIANDVRRVIRRSASAMAPEDRSLYLGLVVGDDRDQSEMQRYWFKASGLSHLLAVSGQNVAFVLALVSPLTRRLGPRAAVIIAVPLLGVFALITRAEPSVLRAVMMACIGLLAVATDRKVEGLRILALTVITLVMVDPMITHSMAFTLSVSATLGLIVLTDPLVRWLRGPPWLTEPLSVTIAAQLATAPLLFTMTGSLPSVATIANLAAVPVSGFVMMAGLTVGLFAGSIRADAGAVLMWPVGLMVRWVGWVAETASRLPMAHLTPRRLVLLAVLVVAVTAMVRGSWRPVDSDRVRTIGGTAMRWIARMAGVIIIAMVVVPVPMGPGHRDLEGGATFIRTVCGGSEVVVGKGARGITVLESLDMLGVTSVDVVIHDGSRSAEKAAHYVGQRYRGSRVMEVDVGHGAGTDAESHPDPVSCP